MEDKKVALITGGTRGIGKAIAIKFAQNEYNLVLNYVSDRTNLEELNQEFKKQNLTFSSHIENSSTPICYITHCEDSIFKSERNFILEFDELKKVKDFTDYYFIEFIK